MDGTQVYWSSFGEEEEEEDEPEEKSRRLEVEVATLKKELAETRKELAAKTVLLSKRDQSDKATQEKWAEQRASELAAAAAAPKEQLIRSLEQTLSQLEVTLAQRTEELEETKRLFASQKRALKDALSAAAEREAAEVEADAAGQSAATAAVEEEMERLLQELSQLRTRSALELQAREAEIQSLKAQLALHEADRQRAVKEAQAAAAAQTQAALAAAAEQHAAQVADLQSELGRLRSNSQHSNYRGEEQEDLSSALQDLAAINKEKLQLQRDFDAYKDLTAQTARQHREEQARLLEENAALKARIAAEATRVAMGTSHGHASDAGVSIAVRSKTFAAVTEDTGLMDRWISRLERQRRGLVPLLTVASLLLLFLFIAVVRAAASASGEQKGAVCFLSKLGIQIGAGCGSSLPQGSSSVSAVLSDIVEATPRVKDVESKGPTASNVKDADSKAGRRRRDVLQHRIESSIHWRHQRHFRSRSRSGSSSSSSNAGT